MSDEDNNDEDLFTFLKAVNALGGKNQHEDLQTNAINIDIDQSDTMNEDMKMKEISDNKEIPMPMGNIIQEDKVIINEGKDEEDDGIVNEKEIKQENENEEEINYKDKLNISVDERMIRHDEDDEDSDEDKDEQVGVINFKAEIEAKEDDNDNEDNENEIITSTEQKNKVNTHNEKVKEEEIDKIIISNNSDIIDQLPQGKNIELNNNVIQLKTNEVLSMRITEVYNKADFEIISLIHKGYNSSILKAKHIKNEIQNQIKVFKVIDKTEMKSINMPYKIYLEKEILDQLDHFNIIHFEGAFEEKDKIFLILDYLSKGNFSDFLKINYPLNDDTVRFYAGEIINSLECLREHNIIHCNLKPDNIMLDENYHIKLIGFSNAKMQGRAFNNDSMQFEEVPIKINNNNNDKELQKSILFNPNSESPEFTSPEIIEDLPCGFGTDLWSLGCILYQMYVGSTPFKDKSDHLIVQNIQRNKIEYPPYIPEDAKDLISKLLVNNNSKRLGAGDKGSFNDFSQLKSHSYFDNVNFNKLHKETVPHQSEFRIIIASKPQLLASKTMTSTTTSKIDSIQFEGSFMRRHTKTIATIKQAIVQKKSPWLHYNRRKIVLDTTPKLEYIDPSKNIVKGVIFLNKECRAINIEGKIFELITPKRIFRFKVLYIILMHSY